jgi:hypothetical protein
MTMTPYDVRNKYAAILAAQPLTIQSMRELDGIYDDYLKDAQQTGWTGERIHELWENICKTADHIRRNAHRQA